MPAPEVFQAIVDHFSNTTGTASIGSTMAEYLSYVANISIFADQFF